MQSGNQELIDAAFRYADAVKALKLVARQRGAMREAMDRLDLSATDAEIAVNAARRRLDTITRRVAEDRALEESMTRDEAPARVQAQVGAA